MLRIDGIIVGLITARAGVAIDATTMPQQCHNDATVMPQ